MDADATRLARMRVMELLGEQIGDVVEELYSTVAADPDEPFHFPTGPKAAGLVGYPEEMQELPAAVVERFAGVGCPLKHEEPRQGDAVLDVGCGAGTDVFVAARKVGPSGRVVGVDLTGEMVRLAQGALDEAGIDHAIVLEGSFPRADVEGPFDLVTSNGVLNLIPAKERVLEELRGLLRPGGRLVLSDIVLTHPPSRACLMDTKLWAECLVGAFTEDEYLDAVEAAGFGQIQVHERRDYFQHSASKKTRETAEDLGAFAWVITARPA